MKKKRLRKGRVFFAVLAVITMIYAVKISFAPTSADSEKDLTQFTEVVASESLSFEDGMYILNIKGNQLVLKSVDGEVVKIQLDNIKEISQEAFGYINNHLDGLVFISYTTATSGEVFVDHQPLSELLLQYQVATINK